MNKKFLFPNLFVLAASFGIQFYLSLRSYSLKADETIANWCPVGENKWNCDEVITSNFSEVFGIAISNFGAALQLVCFLLILLLHFGLLDQRWRVWVWGLAVVDALASAVMFSISWFALKSFCILCTACYLLSLLFLFFCKKLFPSVRAFPFGNFGKQTSISLESFKPPVFLSAALVILAILFHVWSLQMYPVNTSIAESNFQDWKRSGSFLSSFDAEKKGELSKGPKDSSLVITEFSDMLCPYCARVYFVLKSFQESKQNVRVEYMHFPLDSRGCEGESSSVSASCLLAKAVWCIEKNGKGLELQDFIFKTQSEWISVRSRLPELKSKIQKQAELLIGDAGSFQECLDSAAAMEAVSRHVSLGKKLEIIGTPALFVNGKKLRPASVRLALEKIENFIKEEESGL